jgi:hypothetical protein
MHLSMVESEAGENPNVAKLRSLWQHHGNDDGWPLKRLVLQYILILSALFDFSTSTNLSHYSPSVRHKGRLVPVLANLDF